MIGGLYRPPNRTSFGFDVEIETLLQALESNYQGYAVILAGDMNFDLLRNRSLGVKSYLNFLLSCGFVPQILRPTSVTARTASLIDHILISECSLVGKKRYMDV